MHRNFLYVFGGEVCPLPCSADICPRAALPSVELLGPPSATPAVTVELASHHCQHTGSEAAAPLKFDYEIRCRVQVCSPSGRNFKHHRDLWRLDLDRWLVFSLLDPFFGV